MERAAQTKRTKKNANNTQEIGGSSVPTGREMMHYEKEMPKEVIGGERANRLFFSAPLTESTAIRK